MSTGQRAASDDLLARLTELEGRHADLSARMKRTAWLNGFLAMVTLLAVLTAIAPLAWPQIRTFVGESSSLGGLAMTEKGVSSGEFSLRDRNNRQMSVLECDKFGAPNLVMLDLKQRYRVGVKVWDDDRADLNFYDTLGRLRGRFGVGKDGEVALVLSAEEGKERAKLSVSADGQPNLRMMDAQGKVVFQAP